MKKFLTIGLALLLMLSLVGCSDGGTSDNGSATSEITQAYINGEIAIDYADAASFEKALNDGEKVYGKIVQFDVVEYKPDSALGIDCWSGEHLNFISDHELDVSVGDLIVGYVTKEASKILGSWKIPYEVIEIQSNSISREIVDLDDNNSTENDSQVGEVVETGEKKADVAIDDNNQVTEETKPVTEETKSAYNITDTTAIMYVASTANVRSEPDKNASKLGTLSQNDEVAITGRVDNGWYRINYNGNDGFVKGDLLSAEKIAVQEAPPVTNNDNSGNGGSTGNGGASGNGGGSSGVTVPSTGDTQGNLVWIPTNGGTKYHSKSSCSNMVNPMQVTLEHAEANGFTPCKRCH